MILGGLHPCSTVDYPRLLACVLFTRGCNYNCFYCHNRDLIKKEGAQIVLPDVIRFLEGRKNLLDAVVISGGEPTLQSDLREYIKQLKALGYMIKLDTNGSSPEMVLSLADEGLLNYIAVDLKAPERDYSWVCGGDYSDAATLLKELNKRKISFEARCTVYPGMNEESLLELLSSIEHMPLFRLNAFKMPQAYDASHAFLLRRPVMPKEIIKASLGKLRGAQPNVIC